jgi:hypothetical protein
MLVMDVGRHGRLLGSGAFDNDSGTMQCLVNLWRAERRPDGARLRSRRRQ